MTTTAAIQASPTSGPVTSRPTATRRACTAPSSDSNAVATVSGSPNSAIAASGRLRLGASVPLVGLEGFQEPKRSSSVTAARADGGPGAGRRLRQVAGDRVAADRAAQVAAGHGRSPSRAVTAAENSCQEDRSLR